MTWDPTTDERPHIYVHTEVPSSDDVRTFYELPSVIAGHVREVAPDAPFVEAMVQMFEGIDEWRECIAALHGQNQRLRDVLAEIVDLCNAMREFTPTLNLDAERTIRAGLDAAGWTA